VKVKVVEGKGRAMKEKEKEGKKFHTDRRESVEIMSD